MIRRLGLIRIASGLVAVVILASASLALAGEITRDSYREAVEPICKANTQANERILGGVRKQVRQGKLKRGSVQFSKAAKALRRTIGELKAVRPPPADAARLAKWLRDVGAEASLFESAAAKLRAGNKIAAEAVVVRLTHNATIANNVALPFEFHYCRFEPSRFT